MARLYPTKYPASKQHFLIIHCNAQLSYLVVSSRYLCDFIYYTSLSINSTCTAFVHVPPLNKPYSAVELACGLRHAILAMLEQCSAAGAHAH